MASGTQGIILTEGLEIIDEMSKTAYFRGRTYHGLTGRTIFTSVKHFETLFFF